MYASILHVLRDGIFNDLAVLCHSVKLYLVGFCHELRDDNRIFFADLAGHLEEAFEFLIVLAYVHGRSREHVRWANEHREAYPLDEGFHIVHACQSAPLWLVNAKLVEHG